MTLPYEQYRDPAIWLEKKQERELKEKEKAGRLSCKGCVHQARVFGVEYCAADHCKAGKANMVRCNHFQGVTNV